MSNYTEGAEQQRVIISAKPDWTPSQWNDAADVLQAELTSAYDHMEHLRGRLDTLGLHILKETQ